MSGGRTQVHNRTIRLDGFTRDDGLFDVEARLTDVKFYELTGYGRGPLPPGQPQHDMVITMTFDADRVIRAFTARGVATPHPTCEVAVAGFDRLVGLSLTKGFLKRAAERIGGVQGCTHVRELLQQLATIAFHTMRETRNRQIAADPTRPPPMLDTCMTWDSTGELVRVRFPEHYRGPLRKPLAD